MAILHLYLNRIIWDPIKRLGRHVLLDQFGEIQKQADVGYTVRNLLNSGYNENNVVTAGYSINELVREGLSTRTKLRVKGT